jgi:CheY-like chemotaxis protein
VLRQTETDHASLPSCKTILVVEDEFLIRWWVAEVLRDEGYNVLEAVNGDEAVRLLRSGVIIDLVFSDVKMPGVIDGLALLAYVRDTCSHTKVVISSGHLRTIPSPHTSSTLFLPKPYTVEQVQRTIDAALRAA